MNHKDTIIKYMQDTFLLEAWSDYSDEHGLTYSDQNFTVESMPEPKQWVQEEAQKAAEDLYERITTNWRKETSDPNADLATIVWNNWLTNGGNNTLDKWLENWAYYATMSGMGHGISWEDDHESIVWRGVEIEVHSLVESLYDWEGKDDLPYQSDFSIEGGTLVYNGNAPEDNDEAFAISIAKWTTLKLAMTANPHYPIDDSGLTTCGLCMLHFKTNQENACRTCPVYQATRRKGCEGTPYDDYCDSPTAKNAQAEIDFLISVRDGTYTREITLSNTKIDTWFERDRQMVCLIHLPDQVDLVTWWDEAVTEAVEDGFLHMDKQLHQDALDYYHKHFAGQAGINIYASEQESDEDTTENDDDA